MHLTFESVRGRHRDNASASRAGSGRALATTAATAAAADESAHNQESNDSNRSPDQDVRHSAPRFRFVVRNSLASQPHGRIRLSSRRLSLCTIPFLMSVGKTTKLKSYRTAHQLLKLNTLEIVFWSELSDDPLAERRIHRPELERTLTLDSVPARQANYSKKLARAVRYANLLSRLPT